MACHADGPAAQRFIGVDVGGTKVAAAVLSHGVLREPGVTRTERSSTDALIEQIVDRVRLVQGDEPATAVGVGVPSVVEWPSGHVRSSINIPLQDVPLQALLRERLGAPVFVDNDAALAALAEAHRDDGTLETQHLVLLTVGTGVGGGIVVDGHLYRGATGAAAEFGHMVICAEPPATADTEQPCFPRPGTLEALASGTALERVAVSRGLDGAVEAVRRARAGDAQARQAIAETGRHLGVGIANVINIFEPDVVAIGGGVSIAGDLLLAPALAAVERFVVPHGLTRTQVRIARSGPYAGVRGAALLASQETRRAEAA